MFWCIEHRERVKIFVICLSHLWPTTQLFTTNFTTDTTSYDVTQNASLSSQALESKQGKAHDLVNQRCDQLEPKIEEEESHLWLSGHFDCHLNILLQQSSTISRLTLNIIPIDNSHTLKCNVLCFLAMHSKHFIFLKFWSKIVHILTYCWPINVCFR